MCAHFPDPKCDLASSWEAGMEVGAAVALTPAQAVTAAAARKEVMVEGVLSRLGRAETVWRSRGSLVSIPKRCGRSWRGADACRGSAHRAGTRWRWGPRITKASSGCARAAQPPAPPPWDPGYPLATDVEVRDLGTDAAFVEAAS